MSLNMLSFNCRSIHSKVPQILDYIIENNIDIALVQKTWLKVDTAIVAQIKEYNLKIEQVRKPRILDIGGGVAMLFKSKL